MIVYALVLIQGGRCGDKNFVVWFHSWQHTAEHLARTWCCTSFCRVGGNRESCIYVEDYTPPVVGSFAKKNLMDLPFAKHKRDKNLVGKRIDGDQAKLLTTNNLNYKHSFGELDNILWKEIIILMTFLMDKYIYLLLKEIVAVDNFWYWMLIRSVSHESYGQPLSGLETPFHNAQISFMLMGEDFQAQSVGHPLGTARERVTHRPV